MNFFNSIRFSVAFRWVCRKWQLTSASVARLEAEAALVILCANNLKK